MNPDLARSRFGSTLQEANLFRTLAVMGVGLISPAGITTRDHAFVLGARLVTPAPSPFVDANDEPIEVRYCPWIGAELGMSERLQRMAEAAAWQALGPLGSALSGAFDLLVVHSEPRADFTEAERTDLVGRLRGRLGARSAASYAGAAGCFAALADAAQRLNADTRAVCIVGVDSYISLAGVTEDQKRGRIVWSPRLPPLAEGAGAIVVMDARTASQIGKAPASIVGSMTAPGHGSDEDDEIVDGIGLTYLLRKLPRMGSVPMVFGQLETDGLRRREWSLASARSARFFKEPYAMFCFEEQVGRVGAAAGILNLGWGVAAHYHRTAHADVPPGSAFYAWAISRDGTRGMALLQGAGASS